MRRGIPPGPLLALPAALLLHASLSAQDRESPWDSDTRPRTLEVGVSGGGLFSTDWSDLVVLGTVGGITGTFQQVLFRDLAVEPGPVANATVTYWEGRYGFRIHAGYSRSCLAVGAACAFPSVDVGPGEGGLFLPPEEEIGVNTWLLDMAGVVRLRKMERARWWRPYVMVGWGGIAYDPDDEVALLLPRFVDVGRVEPVDPETMIVVVDDTQVFLLSLDEIGFRASSAWIVGVGSDLRLPLGDGGIGLRVELTSHTTTSPLRLRVLPLGDDGAIVGGEGFRTLDFGVVHNLRLSAGLIFEFPLDR